MNRSGVAGISWYTDAAAGRVVITADSSVSKGEIAAVQRAAGANAGALLIKRTAGVFAPLLSGGDAIYGGKYRCSLGVDVVSGSRMRLVVEVGAEDPVVPGLLTLTPRGYAGDPVGVGETEAAGVGRQAFPTGSAGRFAGRRPPGTGEEGEMDIGTMARILWQRRTLRSHERWTAERLRAHQQRELAVLRGFALQRSPFYREFHRGLAAAPLDALPVLTKTMLMDNFDRLVTDPTLRLADLRAYLDTLHSNQRFAGRYWVSATSGSSGRRSIIPSDAREWATIIASYARANEWAGVRAGPLHRVRMAVVSSTTAWHQSSRVAATVRSPFIDSVRLDAASPLPDTVARLNALRPDVLVAYASMIRALAEEQLAGRLRIAPRAVNSSSEVLTAEARTLAARAWEVPPFNVYAATETGGIAAECAQHRGMHLFEDLVIPEVVDDAYRPVPPGEPGDRLLVTVLSSRTIPLIRYEMTDRVTLAAEPCPDGLPFRLLHSIQGRTDDVLILPAAAGGSVRVHPVVFHRVLDLLDAAGWQVRQDEQDLTVLVAAPGPGFDAARTAASVRVELAAVGARVPVTVSVVDAIPAGAAGKRPLVVAHKGALFTREAEPSAPATATPGGYVELEGEDPVGGRQ